MQPLRPAKLHPFLENIPRIEIPKAPLAPSDDSQLVPFAMRGYFSAVQALCDQHGPRRPLTPQETALVSRCMRYLRDDEIPPAAWLRKRFGDFQHTSLRFRFLYPPIGFVFAETRYMEALDHDMGWKDALNYTSYVFSPKARNLLRINNNGGRGDGTAGNNFVTLDEALNETEKMQSELNKRASEGEYIWGANSIPK